MKQLEKVLVTFTVVGFIVDVMNMYLFITSIVG